MIWNTNDLRLPNIFNVISICNLDVTKMLASDVFRSYPITIDTR